MKHYKTDFMVQTIRIIENNTFFSSQKQLSLIKYFANLHGVVDEGGQAVLHVGLDNIGIQRIVHADLGGVVHGVLGEDGDGGGSVGNNGVVPIHKCSLDDIRC